MPQWMIFFLTTSLKGTLTLSQVVLGTWTHLGTSVILGIILVSSLQSLVGVMLQDSSGTEIVSFKKMLLIMVKIGRTGT